MKFFFTHNICDITLSRRNLASLLVKVDGHPPDSACTIFKESEDGSQRVIIRGEPDDVHYGDRAAGAMHERRRRSRLPSRHRQCST